MGNAVQCHSLSSIQYTSIALSCRHKACGIGSVYQSDCKGIEIVNTEGGTFPNSKMYVFVQRNCLSRHTESCQGYTMVALSSRTGRQRAKHCLGGLKRESLQRTVRRPAPCRKIAKLFYSTRKTKSVIWRKKARDFQKKALVNLAGAQKKVEKKNTSGSSMLKSVVFCANWPKAASSSGLTFRLAAASSKMVNMQHQITLWRLVLPLPCDNVCRATHTTNKHMLQSICTCFWWDDVS